MAQNVTEVRLLLARSSVPGRSNELSRLLKEIGLVTAVRSTRKLVHPFFSLSARARRLVSGQIQANQVFTMRLTVVLIPGGLYLRVESFNFESLFLNVSLFFVFGVFKKGCF